MATRFYFDPSIAPPVSPAYAAGWGQTGSATRGTLVRKNNKGASTALADLSAITVPITTTQSILAVQFISEPITARQSVVGAISGVIKSVVSTNSVNSGLLVRIRSVAVDGTVTDINTHSGTTLTTTAATRILTASSLSSGTFESGDRLILEVGVLATAPSSSGTFTLRFGLSAATDFALTAGLTTDINPWYEFGADLFGGRPNNYQAVKVGDGMSTGEKIR